jgi:transcription factor C subunit 6
MKTRKSNRAKSYKVQKYDFESSSSETEQNGGPTKPLHHQGDAGSADENFDAADESRNEDDEDEDDDVLSADQDESEAAESEMQSITPAPARRRVKKTPKPGIERSGYLDLETVTTDTVLKGYTGPFDRSMRGQTLISTWYGPKTRDIERVQRVLDHWMRWTVLPPKHVGGAGAASWAGEYRDKEAYFASRWRVRLKNDAAVEGTRWRTLTSGDETRAYEMPARELRLIMGPYEAQREMDMRAGDSYALSQGWLPYEADETDKKIPTGWIFDVGGIVTGMDWAPRHQGEQMLALAVIPHSDQEDYDYEAEHQRPDFQKHGTVQLWVFEGEDVGGGVRRPSTQKPRLLKTICLDYGRARRLRWSPACDHLAVLCGDGSLHVVEVDGTPGSFGTSCGVALLGSMVYANKPCRKGRVPPRFLHPRRRILRQGHIVCMGYLQQDRRWVLGRIHRIVVPPPAVSALTTPGASQPRHGRCHGIPLSAVSGGIDACRRHDKAG